MRYHYNVKLIVQERWNFFDEAASMEESDKEEKRLPIFQKIHAEEDRKLDYKRFISSMKSRIESVDSAESTGESDNENDYKSLQGKSTQ